MSEGYRWRWILPRVLLFVVLISAFLVAVGVALTVDVP